MANWFLDTSSASVRLSNKFNIGFFAPISKKYTTDHKKVCISIPFQTRVENFPQ